MYGKCLFIFDRNHHLTDFIVLLDIKIFYSLIFFVEKANKKPATPFSITLVKKLSKKCAGVVRFNITKRMTHVNNYVISKISLRLRDLSLEKY